MSSETAPAYPPQPPPSQAVPPSEEQVSTYPPPPPPPISSLKPLLNPLQTNDTPPASMLVEPPRSPNPQNPATDEIGNNAELDLPSASGSVVGPGEIIAESSPAPLDTSLSVNVTEDLIPGPSSAAASPLPPISREDSAQPPLPRDAPVPPTPPQPTDEAPPSLAPGLIPPAVSTPTVITTEDQDVQMEGSTAPDSALAPSAQPDAPPASTNILPPTPPTPLDYSAPVDAPSPSTKTVAHQLDAESMDVDALGEPESSPAPGMESRGSEGSLKRTGEDLDGREEKRIKEDPAQAPPAPIAAPTQSTLPPPTLPPIPVDPNAPPPPWVTYVEPPARPAGPTTPLTPTQHKHLLASIRSLKKIKEAINFLKPVDVVLFGIPHYAQIVTKPMDIETVETKLIVSDPRGPPKDKSKMNKWDTSKGSYNSVSDVVQDVRQIWENTRKFNGPDHVVSLAAKKLEETFEKMLGNMPPEPIAAPPPPPPPIASPAAGPSHPRRPSVSQPPAIRRSSEGLADSRPKREIHPPPSKDLNYNDGGRKPKRRNDPQLQWANKTIKGFETTNKHYPIVAPFLYPVSDIIAALPHYSQVIKKPIDLLLIKDRLENGDYDDVSQVDSDMRLMTKNALTFNRPGDEVHTAAAQLQQLWDEKWRLVPPKQEARDESEDPLAEDFVEGDDSDEEDATLLRRLEAQVTDLQTQITEIKARRARRPKGGKPKAKSKAVRKQSTSKLSPGINGNGHAKKPRKSKEIVYRDDDDVESEDDLTGTITLTQKQELAQKIQEADEETLKKAIAIIQQTTSLGQNDDEIELDIDSLPQGTVMKLYNLVCRGNRKLGRPKGIPGKKPGRKATGGASRKTMNEQEEADRIAKMEAQLQSFDSGRGNAGMYEGGDESDSSEEESSDED